MDRVQVTKQEWGSLGGNAADESPYPEPIEPQEDAIEAAGLYVQDAANRDEAVLIARNGDDMTFKDVNNPTPLTLTDLAMGGSGGGLTEAAHAALDTLLHNVDEDHSILPTFDANGVIAAVAIKTPGGTLIRDSSFGHNSDGLITSVVIRQYDASGAVAETLTAAYTYTSGIPTSITVTRS